MLGGLSLLLISVLSAGETPPITAKVLFVSDKNTSGQPGWDLERHVVRPGDVLGNQYENLALTPKKGYRPIHILLRLSGVKDNIAFPNITATLGGIASEGGSGTFQASKGTEDFYFAFSIPASLKVAELDLHFTAGTAPVRQWNDGAGDLPITFRQGNSSGETEVNCDIAGPPAWSGPQLKAYDRRGKVIAWNSSSSGSTSDDKGTHFHLGAQTSAPRQSIARIDLEVAQKSSFKFANVPVTRSLRQIRFPYGSAE